MAPEELITMIAEHEDCSYARAGGDQYPLQTLA